MPPHYTPFHRTAPHRTAPRVMMKVIMMVMRVKDPCVSPLVMSCHAMYRASSCVHASCHRVKESRYDNTAQMATLEEVWVSAASAKQRRGRAGRVWYDPHMRTPYHSFMRVCLSARGRGVLVFARRTIRVFEKTLRVWVCPSIHPPIHPFIHSPFHLVQ